MVIILWKFNKSTCIRNIYWLIVKCSHPYATLYRHRAFTGIHEYLKAMKHSIDICL